MHVEAHRKPSPTPTHRAARGVKITDYQAKYFAHVLRRRSPSDILEKLGSSLMNAMVDLNPHQKFFISATVLDARTLGARQKASVANPCDDDAQADAIRTVPWDLVVVDEAHRLRNVYKTGNKIARAIKDAGSQPRRQRPVEALPLFEARE